MIRKINSFVTAETVVNMVLSSESLKPEVNAYVEAYQNGREQGLQIWQPNKDRTFLICEHRNSDAITVYVGKYAMQGMSDDAYRHIHSFDRDFDKASEWIIEQLNA